MGKLLEKVIGKYFNFKNEIYLISEFEKPMSFLRSQILLIDRQTERVTFAFII